MAAHYQRPSGDLEDQVRQMIISGSPSRSSGLFDSAPDQASHPAVRLPPSASYGQPPSNHYPAPGSQRRQVQNRPSWENDSGNRPATFASNFGQPRPERQLPAQVPYAQRPPRGNHAHQYGPPPGASGRGSFAQLQQRGRYQQQMQLDPNAFQRGGYAPPTRGRGQGSPQLFNPHDPRAPMGPTRHDQRMRQSQYLELLSTEQISKVDMGATEFQEKDSFRAALERICHEVCEGNPSRLPKISLEPFGSFKSGFATAGSDMDLVIVVKDRSSASACFSLLEDDLPRALEKRLLELGIGARLLSRTRVPILKICEKPEQEFLEKLREERVKWNVLPEEEKYPHLHQSNGENGVPDEGAPPIEPAENGEALDSPRKESITSKQRGQTTQSNDHSQTVQEQTTNGTHKSTNASGPPIIANSEAKVEPRGRRDDNKPWTRERKAGPLDFPKDGVGIQCDINFFNPLGLHNTQLLYCYSQSDPRVRPIVLFVKSWAKHRKINSSYSGTLSSYGYVLMVLNYLTNITYPPVLQNLQANHNVQEGVEVDGWKVEFWRNEAEISAAAQRGQLTQNREPVGSLLAGFFHYYSSLGGGSQFRWMNEVLSLRSQGGILTKEEKGWVKAITEEGEGKKIQHRYLFCIEDPFELSHNVARTVTHKGIVAIRDEFRRAHRILLSIGNGLTPTDGELFDDLVENQHQELAANNAPAEVDGANGTNATNGTKGPLPRVVRNANQQQPHNPQQHPANSRRRSGIQSHEPQHPSRLFNTNDNDAFPALSTPAAKAASTKRKKKSPEQTRDDDTNYSEISGDKARQILERVKMERDEKQAENTATLAAESVLNGID